MSRRRSTSTTHERSHLRSKLRHGGCNRITLITTTAAAVEELDRDAAAGEEDGDGGPDGFGDYGGSYITGTRVGGTTSNFKSAVAQQHERDGDDDGCVVVVECITVAVASVCSFIVSGSWPSGPRGNAPRGPLQGDSGLSVPSVGWGGLRVRGIDGRVVLLRPLQRSTGGVGERDERRRGGRGEFVTNL